MGRVVIGMDPHKRSATIEVLDQREKVISTGRFGTDRDGYRNLLAAGRRWPERVWAVEGCRGVGRHLAQRLVADNEPVLDVPAKLSARVRVFSTGQGRKTDATDAHSIAVVALRTPGLRAVQVDDATVALRLLVDRRDELGAARTLTVNRLHRLLAELIPGAAKTFLSAMQAKALLATVRPRDVVGKTRRKLAAELIVELEGIDRKIKVATKELRELVAATGSTLLELNGIGPSGAARLLGDIGDVSRFPTRGHFASWNGTAPIDASSGEQNRHRLSRAGNRRINRLLHIMAIVQLRKTPKAVPTIGASSPPARPRWKRSAPSNGGCPISSTASSWPTRNGNARGQRGRAREDKWGRLLAPARPTPTPTSTLRRSHFPGPPASRLRPQLPLAQTVLRPVPDALSQRRPAAVV